MFKFLRRLGLILFTLVLILGGISTAYLPKKIPQRPEPGTTEVVLKAGLFAGRGNIITGNYRGSGHCWLLFENLTDEPVQIGEYTLEPRGTVSVGTWGMVRNNPHHGIWYNIESYRVTHDVDYEFRHSFHEEWDNTQLDHLNEILADPYTNRWKIDFTCADFAVFMWNSISYDTLYNASALCYPWIGPKTLYQRMRQSERIVVGYPYEKPDNERVGYFKDGIFINDVGRVANGVGLNGY